MPRRARDVTNPNLDPMVRLSTESTGQKDYYMQKGNQPQPPQPPPLHEWFCEARFAASSFAWIASLSKPLS